MTEWLLLLPLALVLGLNLYLTVLALGLLALFPAGPTLPGDLETLGSAWALVPAALLYLLDRFPGKSDLNRFLWETSHVVVRLAAVPLLTLLLFHGRSLGEAWTAAAVAGSVAVLVQGLRTGRAILLPHRREGTLPGPVRALMEDLGGAVLLVAALYHPGGGAVAAALLLSTLLLSERAALRAALFTPHLLRGLAWDLTGTPVWRDADDLPPWITPGERRSGLRDDGPVRGTPAAVIGVPGSDPFRRGWIVVGPEGPVFHYRTSGRLGKVDLREARPVGSGAQATVLGVDGPDPDKPLRLLLPRGVPVEEVAGRALP